VGAAHAPGATFLVLASLTIALQRTWPGAGYLLLAGGRVHRRAVLLNVGPLWLSVCSYFHFGVQSIISHRPIIDPANMAFCLEKGKQWISQRFDKAHRVKWSRPRQVTMLSFPTLSPPR
jgi:hypothetical protein